MAREPADTANFDDDLTGDPGNPNPGGDDRGDELDEDEDDEENDEDEGDKGDEEDRGDDVGDPDDLDPDALADIATGDGSDGKPPKTVSYARFVEVNERAKRYEDALLARGGAPAAAAAAPAQPAKPAFDLEAKIRARNAALVEGNEDDAAKLDLEIEEHRIEVAEQRAAQRYEKSRVADDLNSAAEAVMAKYPVLNDTAGNKQYDPEVLEDVVAVRDRLIAKGVSPVKALQQAADRICGKGAAAAAPDPKDKPAKGAAAGKSQREIAELLKRGRTAASQPPSLRNAGTPNRERIDVASLKVEDMSDEEYEALPEKVKHRLRGDGIASN